MHPNFSIWDSYRPDLKELPVCSPYLAEIETDSGKQCDVVFSKQPTGLHALQAGPLGETSLGIALPDGVLMDESGKPVSRAEIAPSDLLAVAVGLAAASLDFAAGHRNFTFNNLLACLICCDILQVTAEPRC